MQKDLITLKKDVYDAINMYLNNHRHPTLKENYEMVYNEYKTNGGTLSIEQFEQTIDDYNVQGICGY